MVVQPQHTEECVTTWRASTYGTPQSPLDRSDLISRHPAIQTGLADANAALSTDYVIEAAQIVENDSRQPGICEYLTRKVIE